MYRGQYDPALQFVLTCNPWYSMGTQASPSYLRRWNSYDAILRALASSLSGRENLTVTGLASSSASSWEESAPSTGKITQHNHFTSFRVGI